ncbi:MAG: hypothetical protein H6704_02070 [Myxococcales bacterium]|nr:hypothetical protein [Myxococcales bacterium]
MTAHEVDKKLEGRLFDLLEREARIRLGELVQLRRRSRARGMTLLHAAVEAGLVQPPLSDSIARAAGLTSASAPASVEATDEFDALPRLGSSDGDVLDDSLLDSVVDPLDPEQLDHSVDTELRGFDAFEATPAPVRVPSGPPPLPPDASGERPIPLLRAPPQAARPGARDQGRGSLRAAARGRDPARALDGAGGVAGGSRQAGPHRRSPHPPAGPAGGRGPAAAPQRAAGVDAAPRTRTAPRRRRPSPRPGTASRRCARRRCTRTR